MPKVAGVYILDIPYFADKAYTYYIPAVLEDTVVCGSVVQVPFGKGNRSMTGIVAEVSSYDEVGVNIKPVTAAMGDSPLLNEELLGLCLFIKQHTLCTFGEALHAVVPSAALSKIVTYYRLIPEAERISDVSFKDAMEKLGTQGQAVYAAAMKKQKFSRQYLQSELEFDCTRYLSLMMTYNLCEKCTAVKNPSRICEKRIISFSERFAADVSADESVYDAQYAKLKGSNRKKIFAAVRDSGPTDEGALYEMLGITPSAGKSAVAALSSAGILSVTSSEQYRNHYTPECILNEGEVLSGESLPTLTDEQERAKNTITTMYSSGKPCAALLFGVTGSGKTNVILSSIDRVLEDGRGVIMLVPEIALTPQTVGIFIRRYGERIAVIHSGLSMGERYDAWRRIRDGGADVVIGTRSAVFAPLKNIGMIIIDEEQEYTYKSDTNPKYLAHDIARYRCREHNAVMLLSSATPSVSSFYKAKSGVYTLVELKERYGVAKLPEVRICDMRGEASSGNLSLVGEVLASRLRVDKQAGNQSILFLNRRGYNNYVSCRSCGESIKCPNCSQSLTYHKSDSRRTMRNADDIEEEYRKNGYLICHMCGYRTRVPEKCPGCGKDHFLFMGCGTQKAEEDVVSMLTDLRVLRMDLDTTQKKYSHEEILSRFRAGEADVLLGTQMVTKGHDFPKVATVGVLNADSAMLAGDYRAGERAFAMLTQVTGRAGRADVPGVSIIQTYNPASEVIQLAARQDYEKFYEGEIKYRRALCFPPFCDIAVITLSSSDEGYLGLVTKRMYERIVEHTKVTFSDVQLMVYGPFEAPVYRVQNICRMRFVMKCRLNRRTREFLSELMTEFGKAASGESGRSMPKTKNNGKITVSVDLNPSTV